ncbi:MAG TPA: hypothetical protein VGN33_06965 [Leifsonia sp.]|nr:hypothetical protein [Leifsonia sp.]
MPVEVVQSWYAALSVDRNLAQTMEGDDAELRAALMVSSILGITIARHFFNLTPLVDAIDDQVAAVSDAWLAPLA